MDECDENETPLIEFLPDDGEFNPDRELFEEDSTVGMDTLLKTIETELKPRHAEYVKMHFGIGCTKMTYEEIGEEFCVSADAVEKAVKIAIEKIRKIW